MNENECMFWLGLPAFCLACGIIGWQGEMIRYDPLLPPCCL